MTEFDIILYVIIAGDLNSACFANASTSKPLWYYIIIIVPIYILYTRSIHNVTAGMSVTNYRRGGVQYY